MDLVRPARAAPDPLLQQMSERVRLLPRAAAGAPHLDFISQCPFGKIGQYFFLEHLIYSRIPKKLGDVDRKAVKKTGYFPGLALKDLQIIGVSLRSRGPHPDRD